MFIGDYMGRRALYTPDMLAVVDASQDPHRQFTYAEMNERADKLANWLQTEAGIVQGDRVGILAGNGVEILDAFFACGKLGAILAPYNWRLHWRELVQIMDVTTPRALIYSDTYREAVAHITDAARYIKQVLHIGAEGVAGSSPYEATLQAAPPTPVMTASLAEEDIACLIFTGGTTGLPKGAQVSHRMIAWNTLNTMLHDIRPGDTTVNVFPMFHTGGLLVYTLPLLIAGGTVVLTGAFDPAQVLALIQDYRATFFAGVPVMYQMLTQADNWAEADLSGLRFCTSGGSPLPVALIEKYTQEKGVRFKQGFGMSEFGPGIFALAPEDALRKAGSIGRPNFFVEARIVDDNNRPLGPNEVGELVLRGPSMCSGYFNMPKQSQEAVDENGFFHTGDLAIYDDEFYFYIVDRKKDMFISGGENIYPAEIEQALYQHPAVHMCAVIGVPDAQWGEVGKALVVLARNASATEAELIAHLQAYLARYKVPRSVEFVETLPISGAGKVLKRELRAQYSG
ncbi:MAG: acyl-CoA synthetase [Anaerolineales bacterium]